MRTKKTLALIMAFTMIFSTIQAAFIQAAVVSEGWILYSNIRADVDGYEIPIFVSDEGRCVIAVSDLSNYGFDIAVDTNAKTAKIAYNPNKPVTPLPTPEATVSEDTEPDSHKFKYFPTNWKVYVGDRLVDAWNVSERVSIRFKDLDVFCDVIWDEAASKAHIVTKGGFGEKVGALAPSKARTFITTHEIPNYLVGSTVVVLARDLAGYGFKVSDSTNSVEYKRVSAPAMPPKTDQTLTVYAYDKELSTTGSQKITTVYRLGDGSFVIPFDSLAVLGNVAIKDDVYTWTPGGAGYYTISGKVTDKSTGKGLNGAKLSLWTFGAETPEDQFDRVFMTDKNGEYTIDGVEAGLRWVVMASLPGYGSSSTAPFEIKSSVTGQNIVLSQTFGSVRGTITDKATGDALPGAFVRLQPSTGTALYATTDQFGKYLFTNVASTAYTVEATAQGYAANETITIAVDTSEIVQDIALTAPGFGISGSVILSTASNNNINLGGIPITLRKDGVVVRTAYTNASGRFTIPSVNAGDYLVVVDNSAQYTGGSVRITMGSANTAGVNIQITPVGAVETKTGQIVTGRVRAAENLAVSGMVVRVHSDSPNGGIVASAPVKGDLREFSVTIPKYAINAFEDTVFYVTVSFYMDNSAEPQIFNAGILIVPADNTETINFGTIQLSVNVTVTGIITGIPKGIAADITLNRLSWTKRGTINYNNGANVSDGASYSYTYTISDVPAGDNYVVTATVLGKDTKSSVFIVGLNSLSAPSVTIEGSLVTVSGKVVNNGTAVNAAKASIVGSDFAQTVYVSADGSFSFVNVPSSGQNAAVIYTIYIEATVNGKNFIKVVPVTVNSANVEIGSIDIAQNDVTLPPSETTAPTTSPSVPPVETAEPTPTVTPTATPSTPTATPGTPTATPSAPTATPGTPTPTGYSLTGWLYVNSSEFELSGAPAVLKVHAGTPDGAVVASQTLENWISGYKSYSLNLPVDTSIDRAFFAEVQYSVKNESSTRTQTFQSIVVPAGYQGTYQVNGQDTSYSLSLNFTVTGTIKGIPAGSGARVRLNGGSWVAVDIKANGGVSQGPETVYSYVFTNQSVQSGVKAEAEITPANTNVPNILSDSFNVTASIIVPLMSFGAEGHSIEGSIVDKSTADVTLSNIWVRLYADAQLTQLKDTVKAAANGAFKFTGVQDGTYWLVVDNNALYKGGSQQVDVGGANLTNVTVNLLPGAALYSVSGTITDTSGNNVVLSSVLIELMTQTGAQLASVNPDSAGDYSFTKVPDGTYTVKINNSVGTFTGDSKSIIINGANKSNVDLTLTP